MREHGADGVEYPVRAYLDCYQVLRALADAQHFEEAGRALEEGRGLLLKRAANIRDATLRESFLTKVAFNRQLLAAGGSAS
ncbi:MAG: hypothetical protein MUC34_04730 [Anaerolineae bacterium]|nr:hypothetical protein [Anaerolineae bacterium]